jgi:prepilin-type N-terminal cleavage/methylation domain-containing protein
LRGLPGRGGFTLVELLVALAIMVLVAASLPVALNRMLPARRAITAADRLVGDIRYLQEQAMRSGLPGQLEVLPAGYRLSASGVSPREITLAKTTTLQFRGRGEERTLAQLMVFPDGTATAGTFAVLDSGRRAVVEVSMLTGKARRRRE